MNNFYILEIESLVQTFTVLDTGKAILFSFSAQTENNCLGNVTAGDLILGYYTEPIDEVRILFEVSAILEDSQVELIKKLEVERGVELHPDFISELEQETIINISGEMFDEIYIQMLEKQERKVSNSIDRLLKLENKKFALESVRILQENNVLTTANLDILLSKTQSSKLFKNSFPILLELDKDLSPEQKNEKLRDENGRSRYYPEEIKIGERSFVITNNWYYEGQNGRDTRSPYVNWIKSIINKTELNSVKININLSTIEFTAPKLSEPYNYLVFGAPGTGKSHELKELQEKLFNDEDSYERVTFYSNYSYPNFVGTYKPKMEGKDIVYSYVPGPFIRILEKAYEHPDKNYLLIVEEINRANPAAVFGDIFQLLDRKDGRSEYTIETSEDLKIYFAKKFIPSIEEMTDEEKNQILNQFSKMYIPPNMYIWATMNSADQGVYPMDTAFKRRWDFKYIGVDDNVKSMEEVVFEDVPGRKINWNKLRVQINDILSGSQCRVNEDKLMGPYFISGEVMAIDKDSQKFDAGKFDNETFTKAFKNKVIMYLFEDAAKQRGKDVIFKGCSNISRYSYICEEFDKIGVDIFGPEIVQKVIVID